jgi:hypothetical protein
VLPFFAAPQHRAGAKARGFSGRCAPLLLMQEIYRGTPQKIVEIQYVAALP